MNSCSRHSVARSVAGDTVRCVKLIEIVLKYVGPLYNSAVHAMEPRCGEDPPYPCMPNPIPISPTSPHIPIHLQVPQNTYSNTLLSQNIYREVLPSKQSGPHPLSLFIFRYSLFSKKIPDGHNAFYRSKPLYAPCE